MTAPGFQLDKDPLRNNVMAAVITMLYVHVVIKSMAALVNARLMPPYFSRKVNASILCFHVDFTLLAIYRIMPHYISFWNFLGCSYSGFVLDLFLAII